MIKALPVPVPFDLEQFRADLEHHRSRPLNLVAMAMTASCTGVWMELPDADYIFYERDTTLLHRLHIVGHEIGHLAFGHHGTPFNHEEFLHRLFPHLDPHLIRSTLGRGAYTDTEEQEAEMFASMLLDGAKLPSEIPLLPPNQAELLHRLESAFAAPRRRG